jgi:hypothetical protein
MELAGRELRRCLERATRPAESFSGAPEKLDGWKWCDRLAEISLTTCFAT